MKILLVAGYFPPKAPAAATRANKFARFLVDKGHDIRVLTQGNLPFPQVLDPEISTTRIAYTETLDVRTIPDLLAARLRNRTLFSRSLSGRRHPAAPATVEGNAPARPPTLKRRIKMQLKWASDLYVSLFCWPDPYVGWLPWGTRTGLRIIEEWKPDLIYSTAPPHTSSLLARRLALRTGLPWVCELRDLWVDHPYYDEPLWRSIIERRHERRVLRDAAGLITVTPPWARRLENKYGKPTLLAMNGFDPRDFPEQPPKLEAPNRILTIRYLGILYQNKRDPTPLFQALALLGDMAERVRVQFYGPDLAYVDALRDRFALGDIIESHSPVPYAQSIDLQRRADVLLLLRWDDPGEASVIAGKFFEYLGARRPILSVGATEGVVADIIRERKAGLVSRSPDEIATQLKRWLAIKADKGVLPPLPLSVREGFSRTEQFEKVENFLVSLLKEAK